MSFCFWLRPILFRLSCEFERFVSMYCTSLVSERWLRFGNLVSDMLHKMTWTLNDIIWGISSLESMKYTHRAASCTCVWCMSDMGTHVDMLRYAPMPHIKSIWHAADLPSACKSGWLLVMLSIFRPPCTTFGSSLVVVPAAIFSSLILHWFGV